MYFREWEDIKERLERIAIVLDDLYYSPPEDVNTWEQGVLVIRSEMMMLNRAREDLDLILGQFEENVPEQLPNVGEYYQQMIKQKRGERNE